VFEHHLVHGKDPRKSWRLGLRHVPCNFGKDLQEA
jgi:hypothetical protein